MWVQPSSLFLSLPPSGANSEAKGGGGGNFSDYTHSHTHFKLTKPLAQLYPMLPSLLLLLLLLHLQLAASCPLFTSEHLRSVSFSGCEVSMDWLSVLKPSWPNLQTLSLENCAKTNSRDIQFVADNEQWQSSLR